MSDSQQHSPTDDEWAEVVGRDSLSEITAFIAAMPEERAKAFFWALLVSGGCVDEGQNKFLEEETNMPFY